MSRKEINRGLFVRTVAYGQTQNGARFKPQFFAEMDAEYPMAQGWEIIGTHFTGQNPEGLTFAVFLAQYTNGDKEEYISSGAAKENVG